VKSSKLVQSIVELVYIENSLFFVTQPIPIFGHAIDNLKQISIFLSKLLKMPQPGQKHCKNLPTLKLNMSKPRKTCLRPTTAYKPIA